MSHEEKAGSIEMAFGVWGVVSPSNHVLDGGPDLSGEGAILGISSPLNCIADRA